MNQSAVDKFAEALETLLESDCVFLDYDESLTTSCAMQTLEDMLPGLRNALEWRPMSEGSPTKEGWYLCKLETSAFMPTPYTVIRWDPSNMTSFGLGIEDFLTHWKLIDGPEPRENLNAEGA